MPTSQTPNDTQFNLLLMGAGSKKADGVDASIRLPKPLLGHACRNCQYVNQPESRQCVHCGHNLFADLIEEARNTKSEFSDEPLFNGRYRRIRYLRSFGNVHTFLAIDENSPEDDLVVLRLGPPSDAISPPGSETPVQPLFLSKTSVNRRRPDETDDTMPLPMIYSKPQEPLSLERDLLGSFAENVFPRSVDSFADDSCQGLALAPTQGQYLLDAWNDPQYDAASKVRWLEQLRQTFAAMHALHFVFTKLELNNVFVEGGETIRINGLQGVARIPLEQLDRDWCDLSTAPELLANPMQADLRANGYCFGALLLALHLGRPLKDDDFVLPGIPRPLTELLPDAPPPLIRLLSKTFVHNVNLRFPSPRYRWRDPSGFDEIGEALAEYGRAIGSVGFDIAGWTTTGTIRGSNEDCFTVAYQTCGAREYRRDIALLCVADGMGGHAGGEVASSLALSTLNSYLRDKGLSLESLQPFGREHPFDDLNQSATILREAVDAANEAVRDAAHADPNRPTMGCTLEALLLVDRKGVLCHVGDSRVYRFSEHRIKQITRDQTMVNRLVDLGRLTAEEASTHPRRFELAQAIGSQKDVLPDQFLLDLVEGDWILLCSDGLTAHVDERQMVDVLSSAPNAELAARRLVNLAIAQGGSDNCTLVVVRIR